MPHECLIVQKPDIPSIAPENTVVHSSFPILLTLGRIPSFMVCSQAICWLGKSKRCNVRRRSFLSFGSHIPRVSRPVWHKIGACALSLSFCHQCRNILRSCADLRQKLQWAIDTGPQSPDWHMEITWIFYFLITH